MCPGSSTGSWRARSRPCRAGRWVYRRRRSQSHPAVSFPWASLCRALHRSRLPPSTWRLLLETASSLSKDGKRKYGENDGRGEARVTSRRRVTKTWAECVVQRMRAPGNILHDLPSSSLVHFHNRHADSSTHQFRVRSSCWYHQLRTLLRSLSHPLCVFTMSERTYLLAKPFATQLDGQLLCWTTISS